MSAIRVLSLRPKQSVGSIGSIVGFIVVAALIGAISAILPWWFVLALLILPLILVLSVAIPEFGIVGMLLLICGILPEGLGPQIGVGAGTIKVQELAIVMLLVLAMVRFHAVLPLGDYWRWLRPVILLMALTVISIFVAKIAFGTPIKDILSDARNQLGWAVTLIIISLIRNEKQLRRLQAGIVFVAVVIAIAALAQFVTGRAFLQNGRAEELNTLNEANSDVIRSNIGAAIYFLVYAIFYLLARLMKRSISWWLALPIVALLVASVVVTFGRGVWIAGFVAALVLAFWLLRWKGVVVMLVLVGVSTFAAVGSLALYKPNVVAAAFERVLSTGKEGLGRNSTLGWRLEETTYALKRIASSPIVGVGLGTAYKPVSRFNGLTVTEHDEVLSRYIHNGYLGVWLKFGVLGLAAVLWIISGMIRRGRVMMKSTSDVWRQTVIVTTVAAFLVPVITSFTQPEWLTQAGTAFFGLMIGLQIVTHRLIGASAVPVARGATPVAARRPVVVFGRV